MAAEIYKIEIPIVVEDQTEQPLEQVQRRINRLEQAARQSNEKIRQHMERLAKYQIEPVMRIRDKLSHGVLRAERMLKSLDATQAGPVLAAKDRITAVVARVDRVLEALQDERVEVLADLKGPLLEEIRQAQRALVALNEVQAAPVLQLRGPLYRQLAAAEAQLEALGHLEARPQATLRDRVLERVRTIGAALGGLTGRAWTVVVEAKDRVTSVVRRITGLLASPLGMLGMGAGFGGFVWYPLKLAGEMERARRAVEVFSGGAEAGRENFERFLQFALKSPVYEVPFVITTAGQLMAMDRGVDYTLRALKAFEGAGLYMGATLEDIRLAFRGFQQIAASGVLQLQDLYQVTDNLRIPLAWIAEELGITQEAMREVGRAAIPAERAMDAILRALEKHFPGGLNADLLALVTNLKKVVQVVFWHFGTGMAEPVTRVLQDLTGVLDPASRKFAELRARLEDFGRRVGEVFERGYGRVKEFLRELADSPAWQQADWAGRVALLLDRVAMVAVPKAVEIGAQLALALAKGFLEGLEALAAKNPLLAAGLTFLLTPGPLQVKLAAGGTVMLTGAVAGTQNYVPFETPGPPVELPPPPAESAMHRSIWERVKGWLGGEYAPFEVPELPGYAAGGILARPHIAMVAEAGPEAVIPLARARRERALALWLKTGVLLGALPPMFRPGGQFRFAETGMLPGALPPGIGARPAGGPLAPIRPVPHAAGGILTRPHLGLVAEEGPEAVIPLAGSRRARAIALWHTTGRLLGVLPEPGVAEAVARIRPLLDRAPAPRVAETVTRIRAALDRVPAPTVPDTVARVHAALERMPEPETTETAARVRTVLDRVPVLRPAEALARVRPILERVPALRPVEAVARVRSVLDRVPALRPAAARMPVSPVLSPLPEPAAAARMTVHPALGALPRLPELVGSAAHRLALRLLPGAFEGPETVGPRPVPVAAPAPMPALAAAGVGTVTTGPISVSFHVTAGGGQDVVAAIRANLRAISDDVAREIASGLQRVFHNLPRR